MQVTKHVCDCCSREFHPQAHEDKDICGVCKLDASGELTKTWVHVEDPKNRTTVKF